jgi:hypothetical protein
LIDRAAAALEESIEVHARDGLPRSGSVLLDQRLFVLDDKAYKSFGGARPPRRMPDCAIPAPVAQRLTVAPPT